MSLLVWRQLEVGGGKKGAATSPMERLDDSTG